MDFRIQLPLDVRNKWGPVEHVLDHALEVGYTLWQVNFNLGMFRFVRDGVWINFYATTFTITTELKHPKRGEKTQLHRKNLTIVEAMEIFNNPRIHTGKGYYKKKS